MKVQLILFDWGGTLVSVASQPEALYRGACAVAEILLGRRDEAIILDLARQATRAESTAAADPTLREVDLGTLLSDWATGHGVSLRDGQMAEAIETVGAHWLKAGLEPFPGVVEAVGELRAADYRIGLVSNVFIPAGFCRRELARQGLADLLNFAIFSSEVGYRKPSPIIYEAALAKAFPNGRPADLSRVLFVGDSPTCDVMAPAALGMRTALVASPPGTWPESDLVAARPDLYLDNVAELPGRLRTCDFG